MAQPFPIATAPPAEAGSVGGRTRYEDDLYTWDEIRERPFELDSLKK